MEYRDIIIACMHPSAEEAHLNLLLLIPGGHAMPDKDHRLLMRNLMINQRQWAWSGQI